MLARRLLSSALALWLPASTLASTARPNFVFILTDDQDAHMGGIDHMPLLQKYLMHEGTYYENHFCTVSVCCPSRVNLWTGRAAHNTNVTDLYPPFGGYPKFVDQGHNDDWLGIWLQALGYQTYFVGKFLNFHTTINYDNPPLRGLTGSDILLDPHTYEYWNGQMSRNNQKPVSYAGKYSTDVLTAKSLGFLDEAVLHDDPFFLAIAPIAPHSDVKMDFKVGATSSAPKYAERHAHLFQDYKIPRTANFNPDEPSGVGWVAQLPKQNETVVEINDEWQRARLRSLQSVDEMVEAVVKKLEQQGILDNTYIIYTTDNGYHIGQHRLPPGKQCAFEEDINIPLIIRGPDVPRGRNSKHVTSMTDLAPTILSLAGSDRPDLDGAVLEWSASPDSKSPSEHVNVEFWGAAYTEHTYDGPHIKAILGQTYKTMRLIGEDYNLAYTVWCSGEKEFYDNLLDPGQMVNYLGNDTARLTTDYSIKDRPFDQVLARLDTLLMVTKSCKGESCRTPWNTIFPDVGIKTLKDALHPQYDEFFAEQPRVSFSECQHGYLIEAEGPQEHNVFQGKSSRPWSFQQYTGQWTMWT